MIPATSLAVRPAADAVRHADRENVENLLWRRDVLRRGVVVAVALSVAVLVLGLFAFVVTRLVAQWWIESQGGQVVWEIDKANWRHGGSTTVSFRSNRVWQARLGNDELSHLHRLNHVVSLDLSENDRITNKGLAKLRGLNFLTELDLARLDRFREPRFGSSFRPLSDACLVHLRALPRLEDLTLAGNLITDTGLAEIAQIKTLKKVDLEATGVSDAGLVHLEGMKNLEVVRLGATRVTKEGIAQLRMVRPDLKVELESDPIVEEAVKQIRELAK
jgi:Leucine Rich repeat